MTALDRLNAKLAKLKNTDAADQTVTGGTDSILAILLSEIDETILAREMMLINEAGEEVKLLVAGRRLLRVGRPGPRNDHPPDEPSPDATEDEVFSDLIAAFNGPVRDFLDRASEISIAAQRPHYRVDPTEIGCSADILAQALSVAAHQVEADDPIAAGLGAAVAGLRLSGGNVSETVGDPILAERLIAFAGSGLPALDQVMGRDPSQPGCAILPAPAPRELLLACIAAGEDKALILAPGDTISRLVSLCRLGAA
jgi:hypothetical protein